MVWFILGRNKEEKIKDVIVTQEESSSHILEETIVKEGINNGQSKRPHEDMEVRNLEPCALSTRARHGKSIIRREG